MYISYIHVVLCIMYMLYACLCTLQCGRMPLPNTGVECYKSISQSIKSFRVLGILKRYMSDCSMLSKKRVFQAFVLPILEYAIPS